jgi:hypothetical protein
MMDEDLWGTETGLVSDYQGKVTDAWFGVDSNYNAQTTLLFLKMTTDVPEHPEITERYSCGPDWQSIDGGVTVVHPTRKKFNSQAQAGRLVDRVLSIGAADAMRERGHPPTDAKAWLGTEWFMEAEVKEGKLADGQAYRSVRNYPTKFLGVDGSVVMAGQARHESSLVAGKESSRTDPALMSQMKTLAKVLTHSDWVDKVMELDGVVTDEDLVIALTDENGLYKELREGS